MKMNATLVELIKMNLQVGSVPALIGEPGIGKSSIVEDLAKAMDTQVFTLACNQLADKADLTGGRLVTADDGATWQQVFYPHETIQSAIAYAQANPREWPILFLDEINRSTADVTSAALSLPTARKIGSSALPDNLKLVIAGNDKGNVTALDEASISRFVIYRVAPEAQTLMDVLGTSINPWVQAVLLKYPKLVFEKGQPTATLVDGTDDDDTEATVDDLLDGGEEMRQLTTPRTIDALSRWLNVVDRTKLLEYMQTASELEGRETTMLNEVVEAHIGNTEFATHLVAEISSSLTAGVGGQAASLSAPKPNCFNDLKSTGSVTELETFIAGLTDHEKSGSLLYAIFEHDDNARIIQQLVAQTDEVESDHKQLLTRLAAESLLDEGNVRVLLASSAPVVAQVRPVIETFMD